MSIAHRLNLYVDGDLPGGANASLNGTTSNPPAAAPRWMQGDRCEIKVLFRRRGAVGAASTPLELTAGFTMMMSGKLKADMGSSAELFSAAGFSVDGTGDTLGYVTTLDLNTAPITAAFAAVSTNELTVAIDLEYRDAANTVRLTYRVEVALVREAYAGAYPASLPMQSAGGFRFEVGVDDDGVLQIERVASDDLNPPTSYRLTSAAGYVFELSVSDEGQISIERV